VISVEVSGKPSFLLVSLSGKITPVEVGGLFFKPDGSGRQFLLGEVYTSWETSVHAYGICPETWGRVFLWVMPRWIVAVCLDDGEEMCNRVAQFVRKNIDGNSTAEIVHDLGDAAGKES